MDTMTKIRQLDQIKEDHNRYFAFEIGWMIGIMREKYRAALEMYREMHAKLSYRLQFRGWNLTAFRLMNLVEPMERVKLIEMEIAQYCLVLEHLPDYVFQPNMVAARAGNRPEEEDEDSISSTEQKLHVIEKKVKARNKESYWRKKLGLPANVSLPGRRSTVTEPPNYLYDYGA